MKTHLIIFGFCCVPFLNSCISILGTTNKVSHTYDPYKATNTVKLRQHYHGETDLKNHHTIRATYYNLDLDTDSSNTWVVISFSTTISDTDFDPDLFIKVDGEILKSEADNYATKLFLKTSSSSSSSSSTETEYVKGDEDEDSDDDDKKEAKVTVNTSTQTTTATDMYQFMSRTFLLEDHVLKILSEAQDLSFRIYMKYDAIDVKTKRKDRKKIREFAYIASRSAH
ncbi:MAG: hypothetical protein OEX02_18455 [Cyclobacteriaceae bacterium]|nr:hypothetical protein [Cyclobacteriaceae bacterium]